MWQGTRAALRRACAVCALCAGSGQAAEPARTTVALHAGTMTDNAWEDVLADQGNLRWRDSRAVGLSVARDWRFRTLGFVGIEAGITRHSGEQDHWEIAVPVYIRSFTPARWFLPGVAYGLGLSHATELPEVELDRRGETARTLAFWFIDLEFGGEARPASPFLRLHHRSDAYGLFDADTGSNLLLVGLRRPF